MIDNSDDYTTIFDDHGDKEIPEVSEECPICGAPLQKVGRCSLCTCCGYSGCDL